jgi:2,3-dimethylmalate lyase
MTIELPLGLRPKTGRNRRFAEMVASGSTIVAPGAFDCISARLVETAGFSAVYVTGSGVSMSILGAPDVGVVSFKEIVEHIGRIADVVSIPVIADADTGYGGAVNIFRTVREFERAGVSAIQIEDQEWPKRCGHEPGRRLVPTADMEARLRAAAAARQDPDFKIIARTDARTTEGLDAAIERINRYRDAGADILFVESPESEAELERVIREAPGAHLANMVEGGRTPFLGVEPLRSLGFRIVIFPNSLTRLFARMGSEMLGELARTGTTTAYRDRMLDHRQLWDLFDNSGWVALADKFERPAPNI